LINALLFGGIYVGVDVGMIVPFAGVFATSLCSLVPNAPRLAQHDISSVFSKMGLDFLTSSSSSDIHLLGQHTVRMSPISTAHLNPEGQTFCLASTGSTVLIPVLLNNTTPTTLRYSLAPLGSGIGRPDDDTVAGREFFDLTSRDLKAIEAARLEGLALTRVVPSQSVGDYDDYDEDDEDGTPSSQSQLQKTQSLAHIKLNKPGVLRLERIIHSSSVDARVVYSSSVVVAPCPGATFVDDPVLTESKNIRCAGSNPDIDLSIDIHGVPPLSLRWSRDVNIHREWFTVEGIEAGHRGHGHGTQEIVREHKKEGNRGTEVERGVPQNLQVPLTITVDAIGTHIYTLESVTDSLGNTVSLSSQASLGSSNRKISNDVDLESTKIRRALRVLRRPSTSFKGCGLGHPATLPIGGETTLTMVANDVDEVDAPVEITLQYVPPPARDGGPTNKNLEQWVKTLTADASQRDVHFRATAPGEYVLTNIRGKECEGDILSPEVCKVVEMPLPTAEIEWKRIHEW
jgi:nucleoporin POM152